MQKKKLRETILHLRREDSPYPPLLQSLSKPPSDLWIEGDLSLLGSPALAVVGARECTPYGRKIAYEWSKELARSGLTIISGLALGIDRAAHEGALDAGGKTIAVLGCGIDAPYLKENFELKRTIALKGALVSEFPMETPGSLWSFPQRNRIISVLALGVLVVEAGLKSGSLITARYAREQGRKLFAVPGPITSDLSAGTHELLRKGAHLVTNPSQILTELSWTPLTESSTSVKEPTLSSDEGKVLAFLSQGPRHMDELAESAGVSIQKVSSLLMALEMDGKIKSLPGSRFCIE